MNKFLLLLVLSLVIFTKSVIHAQVLSTGAGTGNWNDPNTWSCTCIPSATSDVVIQAGHTVNLTSNQTIANVTLQGLLSLNTNSRTLTVTGNFTVTGNSTIFGGATSRVINIAGNLEINNSASLAMGAFNMTVTGNIINNGTLSINSNTGVRTFNGLVINNGTWTTTTVITSTNLLFRNGINNFGTFNAGAARFTNNNQSIGGTNLITFNNQVIIAGAITVINNNPSLVFNNAASIDGTVAGSTLTAGAGSQIFYASSVRPMITGVLDAGSNPNTFTYNRTANQDIRTGDYYNLIIEGTGDKVLNGAGNLNIVNNITVENTINQLSCNGKNTTTAGTFTLKSTFNHTEGVVTQHQMGNFVLDGGYLDLGNSVLDGWVINNDFIVTSNGGTIHTAGEPTNGFTVNGNTYINGAFIFTHNNVYS